MTVYVVDDDAGVRDSLALFLGLAGYTTAIFADAEAFLQAYRPGWNGCVVADLRLPGMSGIELQAAVRLRGGALPFIIITAHGDVATARAAFRDARAVDFLEKPFDRSHLVAAIEAAFASEEARLTHSERRARAARRLDTLTARERQVLHLAVRGMHAKEIGAALSISPRTVEVHKARIMEKVGARNVADLVRIVLEEERPGPE